MNKLMSYALAVAIFVAVPSMALAKKNKDDFKGKVSAVDATANTITLSKHKKGEDRTFKTTADTKITMDGVSAKLADITVGMHAKVTFGATPDTASTIDASAHKKGGKKNKTAT